MMNILQVVHTIHVELAQKFGQARGYNLANVFCFCHTDGSVIRRLS